MKRLKLLQLLIALTAITANHAMAAEKHGQIVISEEKTSEDKLKLIVAVKPNSEYKLTVDAPWSLEFKQLEGLKLESVKFDKSQFDEKISGYQVNANKESKNTSGSFSYKLIAFICTKDKTRCYREIYEDKYKTQK